MKTKLRRLEEYYGKKNVPKLLRISPRQYYRLKDGRKTHPAVMVLADCYIQQYEHGHADLSKIS